MKRRIALLDDWAAAWNARAEESEQRVAEIAESLARLGYQVDIFTCQEKQEMPAIEIWQDVIRVIRIPVAPSESQDGSPADLHEISGFMIDFCERQERSYDLVHARFGPSGRVAAAIKSRLGIPFVITFESPGGVTSRSQETGFVVLEEHIGFADRVLREADGIIALTTQDWQELVSVYHADPTYILQISRSQHLSNTSDSQITGWQGRMNMLLGLYEDVLAVRRVAMVQQRAVLLPSKHDEYRDTQPGLTNHDFEFALGSLQQARHQLPAPAATFASADILALSQRQVE